MCREAASTKKKVAKKTPRPLVIHVEVEGYLDLCRAVVELSERLHALESVEHMRRVGEARVLGVRCPPQAPPPSRSN
jgi:hypothetical protein